MRATKTRAKSTRKNESRPPAVNSLQTMEVATGRATDLLRSIGNAHRLAILCLLLDGEKTVTEICEAVGARQSLVSQHLTRLRLDALVRAERQGYFVYYSLTSVPAREIIATLHKHFCSPAILKN
jgi:ArsR family transcriptional regulator, virulence genes transcriptional regulator